jgi:hypothetical protein
MQTLQWVTMTNPQTGVEEKPKTIRPARVTSKSIS